MEKTQKGKIKFWHQRNGYGFIATETGEDVFFHIADFPELKVKLNEEVEFETKDYKQGKKAVKIRRIKNDRKSKS